MNSGEGVGHNYLHKTGPRDRLTNALVSFTNVDDGVRLHISTNLYSNDQKSVFSYYNASIDFRLVIP